MDLNVDAALAGKQGNEYAKVSIDFILTVEHGGVLKVWGFKAKGRLTVATASDEDHHVWHLNEHMRIQDDQVYKYEMQVKGFKFYNMLMFMILILLSLSSATNNQNSFKAMQLISQKV